VKSSRLLVVALVLITLLRAAPALVNNAVFSTDSWPLIDLAMRIQYNPTVRVLEINSRHAKYPSAIISSIMLSEVLGVDVYSFYTHIGSLVLALPTALLFYAILRRYLSSALSLIALTSLAVYTPFTVFTSAYLKEVYAYPVALVLIFFAFAGLNRLSWILVPLVSYSLVLSHPLTSLITLAYLTSLLYVKLVARVRMGHTSDQALRLDLVWLLLILGSLYTLYMYYVGVPVALGLLDVVVLVAYAVVVYVTYFAIYPSARREGLNVKYGLLALIAPLLPLLVFLYSSLLEGVSVGLHIVLHGISLVTLLVLVFTWREELSWSIVSHAESILLPLTVGVVYALTYARWVATITHRLLNYLVVPVALSLVLIARSKPRLGLMVVAALVVSASIALSSVYRGLDPVTFYWRYTVTDLVVKRYVETHISTKLLGSVKYSYMLNGLVETSLDLARALGSCGGLSRATIVSQLELRHGLPVTPLHYVKLRVDPLTCNSLVYSSLYEYIVVS